MKAITRDRSPPVKVDPEAARNSARMEIVRAEVAKSHA